MPFLTPPAVIEKIQFRPTVEYRVRLEQRSNRDFLSSAADDRSDLINRVRAGIGFSSGKQWSGELRYQFAHDAFWRPGPDSDEKASDIDLAFFRYRDSGLDLTVGRQKIDIGAGRLLGTSDWSTAARSFDGVRISKKPWDVFGFSVGVAAPRPRNLRMAGATYQSRYGLTSLFYKHDKIASGNVDHWTLSHLGQRRTGDWVLEVEGALQAGKSGPKNQRAWAVHLGATRRLGTATSGFFEVNAASGGSNPNSSYTFDNLLPTNHKFYGSMDLMSWKNMQEIVAGLEHRFSPRLSARASWRYFSLRDPSDAWYAASGSPNVGRTGALVDPSGKSGRDLGSEFDIDFTYRHSDRLTASGGFSVFLPGSFPRARNGGVADRQTWAYFMIQFKY